jgi:hypothetical protein
LSATVGVDVGVTVAGGVAVAEGVRDGGLTVAVGDGVGVAVGMGAGWLSVAVGCTSVAVAVGRYSAVAVISLGGAATGLAGATVMPQGVAVSQGVNDAFDGEIMISVRAW